MVNLPSIQSSASGIPCCWHKSRGEHLGSMPPEHRHQRFEYFAARLVAEIAFASLGIALLACAFVANQRFLDRHLVPSFFLPPPWFVVLGTFGRLVMGALRSFLVLLLRPLPPRFPPRAPGGNPTS